MKAMGGGGGSTSKTSKKAAPKKTVVKKKEQKLSHAQLAGQWAVRGGKHAAPDRKWSKSDIDRAKGEAMYGKKIVETTVVEAKVTIFTPGEKTHEAARTRMADLAHKLQDLAMKQEPDVPETNFAKSAEELQEIVDCKQLQQEEVEALEAIFMEEFRLSSDLDELRELLEGAQEAAGKGDEESLGVLRSAAMSPPLEFTLQLTVPDEEQQLVASLLLKVRFPLLYPTAGNPPEFNVEDIMVTEADAELREGVPLRTLALVDEGALIGAMLQEVATILPEPCVYEISTWVTENASPFIDLLPEFRKAEES
jgi:hypothetical protein